MYVCAVWIMLKHVRSKLQSQFQSMEVRNAQFAAFIDTLTPNTYVMVVVSDTSIRKSHC